MCPKESSGGAPVDEVMEGEATDSSDEPPEDGLAAFAADAARRQAVERGEEASDVDEAFINRALAESRRMRGEAMQSQEKRAALAAQVASHHGERGLDQIQNAMREHAAEVLTQQQAEAVDLQQQR